MTKQNDKIPSSYEKDAIRSSSGTRRFWRSMKTRIILDMISKYCKPRMKIEGFEKLPFGHSKPHQNPLETHGVSKSLRGFLEGFDGHTQRGYSKPTILDAGCGPGVILEEISREFGKRYGLFGTDVRRDMLKIAKKNVPQGRFFASDLETSIEAKSDLFDAICCAHVIEHLTRPEAAFREFYRVLRPGGALIITTPNYRSLWPVLEWIWDRFYVPTSGGGESRAVWAEQHVTKFTRSRLSALMKSCGFEVAEIGTSLQASIFASMLSERLAEKIRGFERKHIKPFGIELYAVGIKPQNVR